VGERGRHERRRGDGPKSGYYVLKRLEAALRLGAEGPDLEPEMLERIDEYTYRTRFRMSHEEYLGEPIETIEWMLRIDSIVQRIRNGH
jgi:hypothetical protein